MTMGMEFEIKLWLPLRIKNRRLEQAFAETEGVCCGPWSDHMQENTYFDSDDGAVRRARIALRHRRVDGRHVATVKTAAPGGARYEWEREFDGQSLRQVLGEMELSVCLPPIEDICAGRTRPVPIAGTDYLRRRCELSYRGTRVEAAIDRGVLCREEHRRRFAELELELLSGDEEHVKELAEIIRQRLGLRYELRGKLNRAMRLGTAKKKTEPFGG